MDTDGVDIEVLYCEVSAYRYLYLLPTGAAEATRAFNDTLHDFASADPSPPRSSPTRCRSTTSTSRSPRSSGSPRWAASRCSSRCSRPSSASPTTSTSATTACGRRSPPDRAPGVLPHRAQHRARPARRPRPHAAPRVDAVVHAAVGVRSARHVAAHRHPRALPRAARSCSSSPGSAWVAWLPVVPRRHGAAPGLRVPGARRRAAELLLPPQHGDDVHRRARSGAPPAPRARRART